MPSFFVFGRRNHFFSEKYARMEKNDCFTFLGDDDTSHLSNITKR